MPNKLQDPYRHKFEKAKYKISNSREYDQALKNRGSLTIWFAEESIAGWNNTNIVKDRKRGRPATYSDLALLHKSVFRRVFPFCHKLGDFFGRRSAEFCHDI